MTINNYGTVIVQEQKPKTWKRSFQMGKLYITFSNCRVKKRPADREHAYADSPKNIKQQMHAEQGGKCPICGKSFDCEVMELHNVLPWCRFPELRGNRANLLLLCYDCHKEIHCNPFKNIAMMEAKANELGVKLEDHYEIRN